MVAVPFGPVGVKISSFSLFIEVDLQLAFGVEVYLNRFFSFRVAVYVYIHIYCDLSHYVYASDLWSKAFGRRPQVVAYI